MDYLKSRGIQHELTVPYSPEQNGVAERMNRTLTESARSMMAHAGVTNQYWAEAIATAAYLRNRAPTSVIKEGKTPYEQWYGKRPCIIHLKVFGCNAYAHIPSIHRQKLDRKSQKLHFVGYSKELKGYRLLDEKSMRVTVRRDVIFNEADFGCSASTESEALLKWTHTLVLKTSNRLMNKNHKKIEGVPKEEDNHQLDME